MKKNIYFKILKIFINDTNKIILKNIYNQPIKLLIEDVTYQLKINEEKYINIKNNSIKINLLDNIEDYYEEIIFNKEITGFGENSMIETNSGPKLIKNIISGDYIMDKYGKDLLVKNVYVFHITNDSNNQPIIVNKSNCGINLPYQNLILSIKNNLKIKKIILKGRSLYLNRKAELYNYEGTFQYYAIETENKAEYLISGFITDSI